MKLLSTLLISCFFIVVIPQHADAAAVPMRWVVKKSEADSYKACMDMQLFWRDIIHCEGWDGTSCHRQSLTQPNHVWCYQWFFGSVRIRRQHINCNRLAHYYAKGGRFPKLINPRRWDCRTSSGPPSWSLIFIGFKDSGGYVVEEEQPSVWTWQLLTTH